MLTWLLLTLMSWFVDYTWEDLTQKIQEQYVVERYFEWVEEQSPIVYKLWRVLWQPYTRYVDWQLIKWRDKLNRTDCWGMIVWYMMELWLIKTRWKDMNWDSFTYDWWWLNSFRLYTLWEKKERKDVVRWDFIYMEFDNRNHIAIACDTWATQIYDLYNDSHAKCRPRPYPNKALFSSNGIVKFLNDYDIILDETQLIMDEIENVRKQMVVDYLVNYFGRSVSWSERYTKWIIVM